jgi:hypothetical protein
MARTTLTSKGQVTLPKEIREQLGLKAGVNMHPSGSTGSLFASWSGH